MGINSKAEILYIKLKMEDGQAFINFIKNKFKNIQFINQKFEILHENEFLLFPITNNQVIVDKITSIIDKKINFGIISREGIYNKNYKFRTLIEALEGIIPERYSNLIPKSYDIVGHIAIIEFDKLNHMNNKVFNDYKQKIANAILIVNKNIKTVYEKKSQIKGKYRLRELALLYGEDKSETIHKENGCAFKLDVMKTYFSPRLVFERRRIASSKIKENELIIDLFAGVGTFSIQIARNNNVKIYTFDINPIAYEYLKDNIELNKLKGEIFPNNIDVKQILNPTNPLGKLLCHKASRIIMNLPESSINFNDVACYLMKKSGGLLHFYQFSEKPNPIEKTLKNLNAELTRLNWEIESIINSKIVKHYSPKSELVVVDLKIKASK
ncbi:MAG: class I SAM-dependent methyltransferase family protein [Candidatus Lokiarchaeota archaeon]|nr:class I SAM-dependent methyltransferase family protein [Candidatus Lokiarchaeota archaeon]